MIEIRINGQTKSLSARLSLTQLLDDLGFSDKPVIVEKNGTIIRSEAFEREFIEDAYSLELIQLMGGGS